jgi:hypothetical protein
VSDSRPDPASNRTRERALALTWARGCVQDNPCWIDCYDAAWWSVTEGELDDWEREQATTGTYWRYTHPA